MWPLREEVPFEVAVQLRLAEMVLLGRWLLVPALSPRSEPGVKGGNGEIKDPLPKSKEWLSYFLL